MSSAEIIPVFVCLKWGKTYPALYTNVLYRALSDMMNRSFRMVCLTDSAKDLDAGIEVVELPEFALERDHWNLGMWPKLSVFKPGLFEHGTPVIMLDVDVVLIKDLGPMIDKVVAERGVHIIRDWRDTLERWFPRLTKKVRLSNSSVVGFIAGEQEHIWEQFRREKYVSLKPFKNDQNFIHFNAEKLHHWPGGWVLSFKKNLSWHFPVNLVRPVPYPRDAYIVAFHGRPDPEDLAKRPFKRWGTSEKFGYMPVRWVKKYWIKYARV